MPETIEDTSVKWVGNEIAFNVGDRAIKVWEFLAFIISLVVIAPLLFGGKSREIKSVTYK